MCEHSLSHWLCFRQIHLHMYQPETYQICLFEQISNLHVCVDMDNHFTVISLQSLILYTDTFQSGFLLPGLTTAVPASLTQPVTPVKLTAVQSLANTPMTPNQLTISTSAPQTIITGENIKNTENQSQSTTELNTDISTSGLPSLLAPVRT